MAQKWHQKASVQAAISGGVFVLLAAVITSLLNIPRAKDTDTPQRDMAEAETVLTESIPTDVEEFAKLSPFELEKIRIAVETAEELNKNGTSISQAETFYGMANYYYSTGDFQKAVELYKKSAALRPKWVKPYNGLGASFRQMGNFEGAASAYRTALTLSPSSDLTEATYLNNLAATYFAIGNLTKAAEHYEKALKLHPTATRYKHIAEIYRLIGDDEKEFDALTEYIRLGGETKNTSRELELMRERVKTLSAALEKR